MAPTCFCGTTFATIKALQTHATDLKHLINCHCGTLVGTQDALTNHQRDVKHRPNGQPDTRLDLELSSTADDRCGICVHRSFTHATARDQHILDKHHACPICAQVFETLAIRLRHQKSANHCYCLEHSEAFDRLADLARHKRADGHISTFECTNCDRSFRSERALDDHLTSEGHNRVIAAAAKKEQAEKTAARELDQREEAGLRCETCKRSFKSIRAFRQHKSSLKHNPLSILRCPLSEKCPGTFSSPSALLFHLESGTCKGGMTRNKLNAVVYQHDKDRHITSTAHANRVLNVAVSEASHASIAPGSSASNCARSVSVDSCSTAMSSLQIASDDGDAMSLAGSAAAVEADGSDNSTTGSEHDFVNTPSVSDISSNLSGGVILTPTASAANSRGSILTDTASNLSDGGVLLTPTASSTSNALSDWSFLNTAQAMTPSGISIDGSSVDTITFDTALKRWPCNACDQTFRKKHDLIQHMSSIVHAPKIFHCPTTLPGLPRSRKPTINFKTLSGLAQHIEAGSCKGGKDTLGFIVGIFEKQIEAKLGKKIKLLGV